MKRLVPSRRIAAYVCALAAGLCLFLYIEFLGAFTALDTYFSDLFFRLRGRRQPDPRVLIAGIDEKTFEALGRWPLDRRYYAAALDRLREAGAVGFDVIFTEPAGEDAVLAQAVRRHGKTVLPVYLDDSLKPRAPSPALEPRGMGHLHVLPGVDGVIREVFHTIRDETFEISSLSSAMSEVLTGKPVERRNNAGGGSSAVVPGTVAQTDRMRINFLGPPGTVPRVSFSDIVLGRYPSSHFRGKAVLVGLTAPGIVDMVLTPFTEGRNRMAGVEVHANALSNLLTGSAIRDVSPWLRWILAFLAFPLCFLLCLKRTEKSSIAVWLLGIVLILAVSFILFSTGRLWMTPTSFCVSLTFTFLLSYLYRLDEAARALDAKYSSIVHLLNPRHGQPERPQPSRGLWSFLSAEGINARIRRLITEEEEYEHTLQGIIDEKTRELSRALVLVRDTSKEVVLRLTSAGEFRDTDTGRHITRIGLYVARICEELKLPRDLADQIVSSSAMHDIGKIGIPDRILTKPAPLTPEEREVMRQHTVIGERILSGSDYPMIRMSASIALCHHEKWDGTGYPRGLKGDDIPLEARIVMLCDVYDALRSRRPYKPPLDHLTSFHAITGGDKRTSPDHFAPDVFLAFVHIADEFASIFDRNQK